jgi:hypothetical protein
MDKKQKLNIPISKFIEEFELESMIKNQYKTIAICRKNKISCRLYFIIHIKQGRWRINHFKMKNFRK